MSKRLSINDLTVGVAGEVYRLAWERRRALNDLKVPIDNAALPAGSPMYFRCPSCYADIILQEGFLTKPRLCYDCLDLEALDLIFVKPSGEWRWTRP